MASGEKFLFVFFNAWVGMEKKRKCNNVLTSCILFTVPIAEVKFFRAKSKSRMSWHRCWTIFSLSSAFFLMSCILEKSCCGETKKQQKTKKQIEAFTHQRATTTNTKKKQTTKKKHDRRETNIDSSVSAVDFLLSARACSTLARHGVDNILIQSFS